MHKNLHICKLFSAIFPAEKSSGEYFKQEFYCLIIVIPLGLYYCWITPLSASSVMILELAVKIKLNLSLYYTASDYWCNPIQKCFNVSVQSLLSLPFSICFGVFQKWSPLFFCSFRSSVIFSNFFCLFYFIYHVACGLICIDICFYLCFFFFVAAFTIRRWKYKRVPVAIVSMCCSTSSPPS